MKWSIVVDSSCNGSAVEETGDHSLISISTPAGSSRLIAGKLGFWGLGAASPEGEIQVVGKVRGESRVIDSLVEGMRAHGFVGETAVISHCQNEAAAVRLRDRVLELWRDARVTLLPTGGLCSFYAERRGLILAY